MQLDLRQIDDQGSRKVGLSAVELVEWSQHLAVQPAGEGRVELAYQRQGTGVRVTGSVVGTLCGRCASCGVEIVEPLDVAVAATFVRGDEQAQPVDDLRDDDGVVGCLIDAEVMEEERFEGEVVDLRPWLRDEWRLGVPLALRCPHDLCREAADSSQEDSVDPRWAGLEALRDSLPGGE